MAAKLGAGSWKPLLSCWAVGRAGPGGWPQLGEAEFALCFSPPRSLRLVRIVLRVSLACSGLPSL